VAQTIDAQRNGAPEDRVAAIQTLAATGHSGRALGRVRQSLRFAAADQDPEIAARAQEAYDSLMKRDDP
jgi:16S rRNA C1402 N4-methylase RsmH